MKPILKIHQPKAMRVPALDRLNRLINDEGERYTIAELNDWISDIRDELFATVKKFPSPTLRAFHSVVNEEGVTFTPSEIKDYLEKIRAEVKAMGDADRELRLMLPLSKVRR
jgi:hypothetical protein